jgi:hypothetical protein
MTSMATLSSELYSRTACCESESKQQQQQQQQQVVPEEAGIRTMSRNRDVGSEGLV